MKTPMKDKRVGFSAFFFACLFLASQLWSQPFYTQGQGNILISDMMPNCPSNHITPLGRISDNSGNQWDVPASVHFYNAPHLPDMYNTCTGITPANFSQVNTSSLPEQIIDPNGQTITGFLFCDNYFELYVNGVLIGVDPVPFTPFNACMVKFRVSRPYTLAVALVDWEEHPGLGSEVQAGDNYHPGDGGFIAQFSDGTVTDTSWKAQVFYIAPLEQAGGINQLPDHTRSTTGLSNTPGCNANCFAAHYPIDSTWIQPLFDDAEWPQAHVYPASLVTNQPAYVNFASTAWGQAQFIWTSNLILDNVVLARKTIAGAVGINSDNGNSGWQIKAFTENHLLLETLYAGHQAHIQLTDVQGKNIQEWKITGSKSKQSLVLNLKESLQTSQLLFLRIEENEQVVTKKLFYNK